MIRILFIVSVGWLLSMTTLHAQDLDVASRTWTTIDGETLTGTLQRREINTLFIQGVDGQLYTIPYVQLSQADREYVLTLQPQDISYANQVAYLQAVHTAFGKKLTNREGQDVPPEVLEGRLVGLFFGAWRSRESRKYVAKLKAFESSVADISDSLAFIYVPLDRNKEDALDGIEDLEINWLVMPYDALQRGKLIKKFQVDRIPQLIFTSPFGQEASREGIQLLDADPEQSAQELRNFIQRHVER